MFTNRDSLIYFFSLGHTGSLHSLRREGIPFKQISALTFERSSQPLVFAATTFFFFFFALRPPRMLRSLQNTKRKFFSAGNKHPGWRMGKGARLDGKQGVTQMRDLRFLSLPMILPWFESLMQILNREWGRELFQVPVVTRGTDALEGRQNADIW